MFPFNLFPYSNFHALNMDWIIERIKNVVNTVNGKLPDEDGNVNVGTVRMINNTLPDENGAINLPTVAGVSSVCGVGADGSGNVALTNADVGALSSTYQSITQTVNTTFVDENNSYINSRSIGGFLYLRFDLKIISAVSNNNDLLTDLPGTYGSLIFGAFDSSDGTPYLLRMTNASKLQAAGSIPANTTLEGFCIKPLTNPQ